VVNKKLNAPRKANVADADYHFAVSLMQYLVVPTFVLDANGRVLIWNKACERLTGVPAAEVLGTSEHWRGFYDAPRPCLADLVVQNRMADMESLYSVHDDPTEQSFGVHAENWCRMPRLGTELYLAIDSGPIFDGDGKMLAVVETLRDMTSHKRAQAALERLASCDGLTGLANRRNFDDTLSKAWKRAGRDALPLALIMIDVDHFKLYNDTYGHQAGDECLKHIAGVLAHAVLRPSDLVARYGGEEFVAILPSSDLEGAETVARRIHDEMASMAIPHSSGEGGLVTLSMGIAIGLPRQGMEAASLLQLADEALYLAKRGGRNRHVALRTDNMGADAAVSHEKITTGGHSA